MNSKITKKRLSIFLSYEWILMVAVCLASIVLWSFLFRVCSVTPTTGQYFLYYYDAGVDYSSRSRFANMLKERDTFSFDVLEVDSESISIENETLSARLNVYEGDVIITRTTKNEDETMVRAMSLIDSYSVCSMDKLLKEAEDYLKTLVCDGGSIYDFNDMDLYKIDKGFYKRLGKDNRFKTDEQIAEGINSERDRIKKLCENVKFFKAFLDTASDDMFFTYSRYTQASEIEPSPTLKEKYTNYREEIKKNNIKNEGREQLRYGIKLDKLTGGRDVSEYFRINSTGNAENLTVLVFDFLKEQPELQFESISFLCSIIRECSDFITD